jgi:hypothetical protein
MSAAPTPIEFKRLSSGEVIAKGLKTGVPNKLKIPLRLRIDLEIDPDDPFTYDDRVTVTGADGYSKMLGVVSDGKRDRFVKGAVTLVFEGVKIGTKYTCKIDPSPQGEPYLLFKDLELKKEHTLEPGTKV